MDLEGIEALFFDFDGVLADSVDVKTQAFVALYENRSPDIVSAVVAYHMAHGGVSRMEKIRYYETELLGHAYDPNEVSRLCKLFADLVVEKVVASPEIPGAGEALIYWHKRLPLFVVSGTPEEELRTIITLRNMDDLFAGVYGSPRKKDEILQSIITEHALTTIRCLMVGDAMTDYDAAQATGIPFLGIVADGHPSPFPEGTEIRPDLRALLSMEGSPAAPDRFVTL